MNDQTCERQRKEYASVGFNIGRLEVTQWNVKILKHLIPLLSTRHSFEQLGPALQLLIHYFAFKFMNNWTFEIPLFYSFFS